MSSLVPYSPNLAVGYRRPQKILQPHEFQSNYIQDYNTYSTYPQNTYNSSRAPDCRSVFRLEQQNPFIQESKMPTNPPYNPLFSNFLGASLENLKLHSSAGKESVPVTDSGFNSPTNEKKFDYSAGMHTSTSQQVPSITWNNGFASESIIGAVEEESESDADDAEMPSHPNKFPVEIENHDSKLCIYARQLTKSGEKMQIRHMKTFHPVTLQPQIETQKNKLYQKHLVRICRCGKYQAMDGALQQGRTNDCNGYEIHHSQKCKWKAYDDFKTGKRVLIRLCKCYKPVKN